MAAVPVFITNAIVNRTFTNISGKYLSIACAKFCVPVRFCNGTLIHHFDESRQPPLYSANGGSLARSAKPSQSCSPKTGCARLNGCVASLMRHRERGHVEHPRLARQRHEINGLCNSAQMYIANECYMRAMGLAHTAHDLGMGSAAV